MTKYIIKNCPARYNSYCEANLGHIFCEDTTNCLLKQIIEKCNYQINAEKNNKYKTNGYMLSDEILSMLEIQECE